MPVDPRPRRAPAGPLRNRDAASDVVHPVRGNAGELPGRPPARARHEQGGADPRLQGIGWPGRRAHADDRMASLPEGQRGGRTRVKLLALLAAGAALVVVAVGATASSGPAATPDGVTAIALDGRSDIDRST